MAQTQNTIALNFFALKSQNFLFPIYRRENKGEKKDQIGREFYSNTLPKTPDNLNERTNYWISFMPKDTFEKFSCPSFYNNKLTLHYLYYCLVNKVKDKLPDQSIIPQNLFKKNIYMTLKEHQEGKECLLLSPYYLASENRFGFILDFKFLKTPSIPFDRKIQQLSLSLDKNFRSNANFYLDKYDKLLLFKKQFYSTIFPLKATEESLELENNFIQISANTLRTKIYLIKNSKESKSQFIGIKEDGPYQTLDKTINLLFFFKETDKLFVSDLAKALKGELFNTFNGMTKFFRIPNVNIIGLPINAKEMDSYVGIILKEIKERTSDNAYSIPIVIISRKDEEEYYSIKYNLLKNNQPTQAVTLDLLKSKETLKWSVAGIALQIFSKLGGIPWLVKPETKKTLIIGIGQAHEKIKQNEEYQIKKFFSYSILTDSSGIYKELKILGESKNEEDYLFQLSQHIQEIFKKYSKDFDHFVVHVPFKIRGYELEKIKKCLGNLDNSKTFVVIKVNTDNKYFGFNLKANSFVPYESTYVQLSINGFLVWFEGLQYHNPTVNKRIAGPVHIEFYYSNKSLTKEDKIMYLQDILNLSGANWRGFNAKSAPISIFYAQLVAKFIKRFSKFGDINIENIKPWFL